MEKQADVLGATLKLQINDADDDFLCSCSNPACFCECHRVELSADGDR